MSDSRLPRLDPEPVLAELHRQGLPPEHLAILGGDIPVRLLRAPLSWFVADRFAVALGRHPAELWGDDWWAVADTARERKNEKNRRYVENRSHQQGDALVNVA